VGFFFLTSQPNQYVLMVCELFSFLTSQPNQPVAIFAKAKKVRSDCKFILITYAKIHVMEYMKNEGMFIDRHYRFRLHYLVLVFIKRCTLLVRLTNGRGGRFCESLVLF
jgi:hypothetical protein